jgi:hypothetical protein
MNPVKATLTRPFTITVRPIAEAPVGEDTIDPCLLLLADGCFAVGYWSCGEWALDSGELVEPIGFARLPAFTAKPCPETA